MGCNCGKRKRLQNTSVQVAQKAIEQDKAEIVIVSSEQATPQENQPKK